MSLEMRKLSTVKPYAERKGKKRTSLHLINRRTEFILQGHCPDQEGLRSADAGKGR
jgi:hypothetical protein